MRNKKYKWFLFMMIIIICFTVVSCSSQNVKANQSENNSLSYEGELEFSGLKESFSIAYNDIFLMEKVTASVHSVTSTGEELDNIVSGVLLENILKEHGISQNDFESIRLISEDGYAINVPKEILSQKDIILAYEFDGEYLTENEQPLRVAIDDVRSMFFVSNLVEIDFSAFVDADSNEEGNKVIILETAINNLPVEDYNYGEVIDKAVKVSDLFSTYRSNGQHGIGFVASDGFKKTETYEILLKGYLKITGEYAPMFLAPDLPEGMHVKQILTLDADEVTFVSVAQSYNVIEERTIGNQTGIKLEKFLEMTGLDGDYYVFTAVDEYKVELSKESLEKGIILIDDTFKCIVKFDESLPKSAAISDVVTIETSDGLLVVDKQSDSDVIVKESDSAEWIITVEGLEDGSFDFSSTKAESKLECISLHTERSKNNVKYPEDWNGYKVVDLLSFLNVEDFNSLIFIAGDGYEVELLNENIDEETILAILKNDKKIDDNTVQLVQNTKFATTWVRDVAKIVVK